MSLNSVGGGAGDSFNDRPDMLLPSEIEGYIESLQPSTFDELGTLRWIEKHNRVKQLSIQAVIEALSTTREEFVKDTLVTHEKLTILVQDVILIELWRERILPVLLDQSSSRNSAQAPATSNSFTTYTIHFHEVTCLALLEMVLFHQDSAETLEHDALDLIDYCFRAINKLLLNSDSHEENEGDNHNGRRGEVADSDADASNVLMERISFTSLTILRYIIENIDRINSAVVPRLVVSEDAPMLLTHLLLNKPWRRINAKTKKEQQYSLEQSAWIDVKASEQMMLGKPEVQVWLAIYQLFLNPRVISTYEIHHHRRGQLLRLLGLLNEVIVDQLPILGEFQRWLHELSMGAHFGPTKSPFMIEMLPVHRTRLEKELDQRKDEIVKMQKKEILNSSHEDLMEKAKRLASVFDMDAFESVLPSIKCAKCGQPALKKCSRCHFVYYCQRECQVAHWPNHKSVCDKLQENEQNNVS